MKGFVSSETCAAKGDHGPSALSYFFSFAKVGLARRAFRRPVPPQELAPYLTLAQTDLALAILFT
jgi:hypothetical protein